MAKPKRFQRALLRFKSVWARACKWLSRVVRKRPISMFWFAGNCLWLIGILLAFSFAWERGILFSSWDGEGVIYCECPSQLRDRRLRLEQLAVDIAASVERSKHLSQAVSNPTSPNFASARTAIETERQFHDTLVAQKRRLEASSAISNAWTYFSVGIFVSLFSLFVGYKIRKTAWKLGLANSLGCAILWERACSRLETMDSRHWRSPEA